MLGKFDNLDDYLSTNFCLQREDVFRDFKEGIRDFKRNSEDRSKKVNIYKDAVIKDLFLSRDIRGLTLRVFLQNSVWRGNRKLMFGSLCVFTTDNFDKTLFYGVVRDNDQKKNGEKAAKHRYIEIGVEILKCDKDSLDAFEIY